MTNKKFDEVMLLADRIQNFIDWMVNNTDFILWDEKVQTEVKRKLIFFIISDNIEDK